MKLIYEGTMSQMVEITDKEDFYPTVAKKIVDEEKGRQLTVRASTADGIVIYRVGVRSGTQTIFEVSNTLPDDYLTGLQPAYLTCVEPDLVDFLESLQGKGGCNLETFSSDIVKFCRNSYKQYKLIPNGDTVTAYYGRMAVQKGKCFGERSVKYPASSYWIKYYEKIGKGYVDRTRCYMPEVFGLCDEPTGRQPERKNKQVETFETEKSRNSVSKQLFARLKSLAKRAVAAAEVRVPVNRQIITEATEQLDRMREAAGRGDVVSFDIALLNIISILQRPVVTGDGSGVKNLLATKKEHFASIIERESDLLQALSGFISGNSFEDGPKDSFADFGIEVYEATDEQRQSVLQHLSPTLRKNVLHIYRVIPQEQKARFNFYVDVNGIKTVKQLWHGSRNENWMSIILNSLKLNPDAVITGKMFGRGIYFAPSSVKSWGYTSFHGTRWANGKSDTAYMGLYAVAYGTPYDVQTWSSSKNYKKIVSEGPYDCLHAHKGASLRADEIVLYDEAAVLLNYIVEFR